MCTVGRPGHASRCCIGISRSVCAHWRGWRGSSLSVGREDHLSWYQYSTKGAIHRTAHHDCMTARLHVRSQASSLIGLVRLQADPLACSKVDRHACLSPGRLTGLRNPKPIIDTRRLPRDGSCKCATSQENIVYYRNRAKGCLAGSVNCILAGVHSPFGVP